MNVVAPVVSSLLLLTLILALVLFQLKTIGQSSDANRKVEDYTEELLIAPLLKMRRRLAARNVSTPAAAPKRSTRLLQRTDPDRHNIEDVSDIPEQCFQVSVWPCSQEQQYRGRAFYVALSPVGPFCTEWLQHTHCPIHRDRFAVYANCDTKCRSGRCDYPSFRLCATEDKVYQFYFSNSQCHPLPDSEHGCLHGSNRFETLRACLNSCTSNLTRSERCLEPMRVSRCAFDHMRYLYYYSNVSQVCEMYNFCAASAFKTRRQCQKQCLSPT